MFFNPFVIPAVLIGISTYQELMFARMLEGYNGHAITAVKKTVEVPKGYYVCIDCGTTCKRLNASQKRCAECQKKHTKELKRMSDKKRKR